MFGHNRIVDTPQGNLSRFDPFKQLVQYLLRLPGKVGDHGFTGLHRPPEPAFFGPIVGPACKIHGHFDAHFTNITTHEMVIIGIAQIMMGYLYVIDLPDFRRIKLNGFLKEQVSLMADAYFNLLPGFKFRELKGNRMAFFIQVLPLVFEGLIPRELQGALQSGEPTIPDFHDSNL